MDFELDLAVPWLERTPRVIDAMLRGLPAEWWSKNEGGSTWSPFDVVGHLIHGERTDWIPRARIILEHGDSRPFDPFDRFAQFDESAGKGLEELLDTFAELRAANLETLRSWALEPEQLSLRGRHPALGPVTLGELLATWVAHDLDHIAQVARVLARQYESAVGPWREYLSIVQH